MNTLDLYKSEDVLKVTTALQAFIIEEMKDARTEMFEEESRARHAEEADKAFDILYMFKSLFDKYVG